MVARSARWLVLMLVVLVAALPPQARPTAAAPRTAPLGAFGAEPIGPDNVARMEKLARLGNGRVGAAAYSPDGRLIAVASGVGVVLYDAATSSEAGLLDTASPVYDLAFSRDGQIVAAAGSTGVSVWRVADRARLGAIDEDLGFAGRSLVSFSPDGQTLAMVRAKAPGTVELYQVPDGTPLRTLAAPYANAVAFSPDGEIIAASGSRALRLWRAADGTVLHELVASQLFQGTVAFSPDGQIVASSWENRTIRLWRISDGSVIETMQAPQIVTALAFSPDGQLLVSGHGLAITEDDLLAPHLLQVWRVGDGALVRTIEGHTGDLSSVSISPDGQTLLSAATDETVRQWRISDGAPIGALGTHTNSVLSLAFAPDGRALAAGSGRSGLPITAKPLPGGAVRVWQVEDGIPLWTAPHGSGGAPRSVAFSPDGQALAVGGEARTIELRQVSAGTMLHTLEGHRLPVNSVAWSADGRLVASGSSDGTIGLWQTEDGAPLRTLQGHQGAVLSVAIAPDGQTVGSGSRDRTVRLWRASDGQLVRTLDGPEWEVRHVVFSPDGQTLAATTGNEGVVRLWQVSDGTLLRAVELGKEGVSGAAFSPDGQVLAVGATGRFSADTGSIILVRVSDGTVLRTIEVPADGIGSLAFSPDGRLLAAGSNGGAIRLWGVP